MNSDTSPRTDGARARPDRHPAATIALHWVSAIAVLLAFAVAWTRAGVDDRGTRLVLMNLHQLAGLLVLALMLARVGTRIATRASRYEAPLPPLMRWAAFATHLVLYALLLAMPLLGWALSNAHGHDVRLAGLPALPALVGADPDRAETLESWHVGLAWVLGAMVVAHVGAALFHHFVRRDGVLRSMLPVAGQGAGRARPRLQLQDSRSF